MEVRRHDRVVDVVGRGTLVGDLALIDGEPCRATLATVGVTKLLSFDYRGFATLRRCGATRRQAAVHYSLVSGRDDVDQLGGAHDDGSHRATRQRLLHPRGGQRQPLQL